MSQLLTRGTPVIDQVPRAETMSGVSMPASVKRFMWEWFYQNSELTIYKLKVYFISKTVRVRDIRPVFELLFGPEPGSVL
jgi:hypothetical protein